MVYEGEGEGVGVSWMMKRGKMRKNSIISVIGVGKSPDCGVKCINSILNQIFSEFELLLEKQVNISEAVQAEISNIQKDTRVKYIFEPNTSLAEKIQKAEGKYLVFIDLRDEISIDYLRLMWETAEQNGADIVVSDLLFKNESENLCYYNLDPLLLTQISLSKEEIYEQFEYHADLCLSWGMLNNKIFRSELIDKCLKELSDIEKADGETYLLNSAMQKATRLENIHHIYYILSNEHNQSIQEVNTSGESADQDNFFQSISTELGPAFRTWEDIKKAISSPKVEYVSFDIFDTLILRDVFEPVDVFKFLNEEFNNLQETSSFIDFSEIRQQGEKNARKEVVRKNPSFEDVTLNEIYDQIKEDYVLNPNVVDQLKKKEIELEIRFCIPRKCGKQLYELVNFCGKKIILTSDMYLPKEVIEQILRDNGYVGYFQLFLSSEIRLGKYTGNLYKHVKRELNVTNQKIIHIGDNWESDIITAQKNGFIAFHLPKAGDLMKHYNPGIYTGHFFEKIFKPNGTWIDGQCAVDLFLGIRCMLSQVQNKFFDFPYMNFNLKSDYNANPYFIGYFALGMHLYALTEWIRKESMKEGYRKIHFLARDGYLPLEAYKILSTDKPDSPKACYTYMSRHLIVLCDVNSIEDIYTLAHKMNVIAATPKKLFKIFRPAIPEHIFEQAEEISLKHGFIYTKQFETMDAYYIFAKFFAQDCIDFIMLKKYQEKLKGYFKGVFGEKECFFDVGYNGRVESALSVICGYSVDSFCLHVYKEIADNRAKQQNFKTHTFFNYQPVTTFLLREQLLSKMTASAVGLDFNKQPAEVLFGEYDVIPQAEIVTKILQDAAIVFIRDYKSTYEGLEKYMNYRYMDASLPLESYLHFARETDRSIFKGIHFEDEFGDDIVFNLCDFWKQHLIDYQLTSLIDKNEYEECFIYSNGALMKLYKKINKLIPKGSKKREWIKQIANFLIR